MAQDVYKQRKSEVEQMNGLIVEKGKEIIMHWLEK